MEIRKFFSGIFSSGAQSLTTGNIPLLLTRFAIPYMAANLLQALYGAADMIIVGQFTDAAGLSAVSIGSQFIFMINSIVIGLSLGGTIMIGRSFGAGRTEEIKETIGTMLTLFAILSVVITLSLLFFIDPIARLLGTPPEAFDQTRDYLFINIAGIATMFAYNALASIFRGFGDSASPLMFVAVACVLNVIGDLALVGFFGWGAAGAAFATVCAQGFSALLAVLYARRADYHFDFRLRSMRIKPERLKSLLYIGLPMAIQFSLTGISFIFIMATVSKMGGIVAAAAIGITSKINGFTMLPPASFSAAISAMVAQNIGANKPKRARSTMYAGLTISLVFGLFTFGLLFLCPECVIRIFTPDTELITATALYLKSFSADFILVCFVFCLNGFFNGCGHTTFTMANNIFSAFAVRVPATWILSGISGASLFSVGFAAPLASLQGIIFSLLYLKSGRWKKSR
ncbi:MAG: MATE family efflux transporter [Synergistaceae bacterium]|nr:MATE family efflux transporter [Synergistaceae bacterium]